MFKIFALTFVGEIANLPEFSCVEPLCPAQDHSAPLSGGASLLLFIEIN